MNAFLTRSPIDSRLRLLQLLRCLACGIFFLVLSTLSSGTEDTHPPLVVSATYEGIINPVAAEYFHDAIQLAEQQRAELLVFQLDTPGGLDTSMRMMVKDMTGSQIPVVVYVSPSGGRAASAGVFLTLAAHVAAMAPGTNIGAAHPVAMGGGKMDKVMKEKVENDAVAYITSIAERRGRNVKWAEDAVRKSVSVTARQALKIHIIDQVAETMGQLLKALDGEKIPMGAYQRILHTAHARIRHFPMSWRLKALQALSDPNIAYVLMTIGMIGLIAELYNPGAILPGIVGAISLIMAFYSLQSLPVNYAGVLLLILGLVFLILEATVTSFGLLALGGITSLLLGSLMLMKEEFPFYQISLMVILPVIVLAGGMTFFIVTFGIKSLRSRTTTGAEGMVGLIGVAKTDLNPTGKIFVHGELWDAVSDCPLQTGSSIQVTGINGLTLQVTPVPSIQKGVSACR